MAIEFELAANWVEKLVKIYSNASETKRRRLDPISDELNIVLRDKAPFFVEPNLQPHNPSDSEPGNEELELESGIDSAFDFIQKFIRSEKSSHDKRVLFVLGDAGMGKTLLLAMFKLGHEEGFWPKSHRCEALKLGHNTIERLGEITGRGDTVLLLDALDEDPLAQEDLLNRLERVLKKTTGFYRVLITCRNHFLPLGQDKHFQRKDEIRIGGFCSPVRYISPFNDDQVKRYLDKQFKLNWKQKYFGNDDTKRKKAELICEEIKNIACRPLVLSFLPEIIEEMETSVFLLEKIDVYEIYQVIVDKWVSRESRKDGINSSPESIMDFCSKLSIELFKNNKRSLSEKEFKNFVGSIFPETEAKIISSDGRALLTRSSRMDYMFAHFSFQEYFAVNAYIKGHIDTKHKTELIEEFLTCLINKRRICGKTLKNTIFTEKLFENTVVENAEFINCVFNECIFNNTTLENCRFSSCKFYSSSFFNLIIKNSEFDQCDLTDLNLVHVVFDHVDMPLVSKHYKDVAGIIHLSSNRTKKPQIRKKGAIEINAGKRLKTFIFQIELLDNPTTQNKTRYIYDDESVKIADFNDAKVRIEKYKGRSISDENFYFNFNNRYRIPDVQLDPMIEFLVEDGWDQVVFNEPSLRT